MNYQFDLAELSIASAVVIPVIVAIVQAIKMTGWRLADRYAPLTSIAVGIIIAFFANHESPDWSTTLLNGILFGLGASGLYSGVKATSVEMTKIRAEKNRTEHHKHKNKH